MAYDANFFSSKSLEVGVAKDSSTVGTASSGGRSWFCFFPEFPS